MAAGKRGPQRPSNPPLFALQPPEDPAEGRDEEMARRIERHRWPARGDRSQDWHAVVALLLLAVDVVHEARRVVAGRLVEGALRVGAGELPHVLVVLEEGREVVRLLGRVDAAPDLRDGVVREVGAGAVLARVGRA